MGFSSWTLGHCRPGAQAECLVAVGASGLSFLWMGESLITQLGNVVISFLSCFCFDLFNCFYNWLFHTLVAHLKNIDSLCLCWFILFEQLVSIFASWTADGLFDWLFSYFSFCCCCWLVRQFDWLALVHSGAGWLLIWPHHDHFTPWFHRTQVQRWPQWLAAQL